MGFRVCQVDRSQLPRTSQILLAAAPVATSEGPHILFRSAQWHGVRKLCRLKDIKYHIEMSQTLIDFHFVVQIEIFSWHSCVLNGSCGVAWSGATQPDSGSGLGMRVHQEAPRWLSLLSPLCCLWSPNLDPGNRPATLKSMTPNFCSY